MRAFNHLCPLAWAALMASLMTAGDATASTTAAAAATLTPSIFEVDLLFPRNETYTPQALMPIVFAMQNPTLASPLGALIFWELWEGNNRSSPGAVNGGLELNLDNLSFSDPLFVTRFPNTLPYPDGSWTLTWSLQVTNCTAPPKQSNDTDAIQLSSTTVFTVSSSGQAPDLVAATSADMCGTAEAYAFDMTSSSDECGSPGGLLGPSPTTNPCAASIDAAAASSIYAAATAFACSPLELPLNPNVTCPTVSAKPSTSSHTTAASTLLALLATLTALIHLG